MQGHNRFWSAYTPYAKQNGGKWNFVVQPKEPPREREIALPDDQEFWMWLLDSSAEWGLINYEQDW